MLMRSLSQVALCASLPLWLLACGGPTAEAPTEDTASEPAAEVAEADGDMGELEIRANGEDFVREGFVTKDGWEVSFDHVYVTLGDVTAYQSEPAFNAEAGGMPEASVMVNTEAPITVDLAAGDESADPVLVETLSAPAGRYNALSWKMVPAMAGDAEGYPIVMVGQATKDGETIAFTLKLEPELAFVCGDFVGDERKGILDAGSKADLEATFHFDHLFGDAGAPPDDDINTGALGFDPLAAIAQNGVLDVDSAALSEQLSAEDYDLLLSILPSLGHVGEGHCSETQLTSS